MTERSNLTLTQRQLNEKAHYDEAYHKHLEERRPDGGLSFPPAESAFHAVLPKETRPYNQDWEYLNAVKTLDLKGKTILELGCGTGVYSVIFAHLGAEVFAVDLSSVAIEVARERARFYGLENNIHFINQPAEALDFRDGMFDAIVGAYILHHIEIDAASRNMQGILKPGGVGVFLEWVVWNPFDTVRLNKMVSRLFPHGDGDFTEDERKLNSNDFAALRKHFTVEVVRFYTLARLCYFSPSKLTFLMKLDHWLYTHFPPIRNTGGAALIRLIK